jgi:hypothetical protein
MGYKPLATVSFSELQSILQNLTLITMDGEQVYTIAPDGFTFEDGVITLNDPPPEYALITAHMEDSGIHGDHAALKNYCLKCTGTPGATAIYPQQLYIDAGILTLLMSVRIDDPDLESVVLYKRHTQAANILEFGISADGKIYCKVGDVVVSEYLAEEINFSSPEFHDLGFQMKENGTMFFFENGRTSENYAFTPFEAPTGENLIAVGGAGVSVAWLAVRKPGDWGMFNAESKYGFPMPHRRPAGAINCYNFVLAAGVIPDLAILETYKCSLSIQGSNATIEAYELI